MPKPNYAFEKRQRELAKKKKQEAKDARKREARAVADNAGDAAGLVAPTEAATSAEAPRIHRRLPSPDPGKA